MVVNVSAGSLLLLAVNSPMLHLLPRTGAALATAASSHGPTPPSSFVTAAVVMQPKGTGQTQLAMKS